MATAFVDMPHDFRMAARTIVDDAGGLVEGYCDDAIVVCLPADVDACRKMTQALESMGLVGEQRWTLFPLGSDNPPESLRHYGTGSAACPRGDRPSYWKYRRFNPS